MRLRKIPPLILVLFLAANACGGNKKGADSAADHSMSPAEAREYILEVRADKSSPPADPSSMEEVFQILGSDDIYRFEGATRYTAGMQGAEGLSVRATIELMSADIYSTVGDLVEEIGRRRRQEIERLQAQEEGGVELSKEEESKLEESTALAEKFEKASVALNVLSTEHIAAGGSLAQEAIKQYPKDPRGYSAAAYYYLLESNWLRYDDMMESLEAAGVDDAGMSYFRAIESLKRNMDKAQARDFLQEALTKNPQLVRAQAELVLVQEDIDARHSELSKLKVMKKDHPIVNIAGPAIESEFEVSQAVRRARGAGASREETAASEPEATATAETEGAEEAEKTETDPAVEEASAAEEASTPALAPAD